jgi:hypothetical protein
MSQGNDLGKLSLSAVSNHDLNCVGNANSTNSMMVLLWNIINWIACHSTCISWNDGLH